MPFGRKKDNSWKMPALTNDTNNHDEQKDDNSKKATHTLLDLIICSLCAFVFIFLVRSSWSLRISYGSQVLFCLSFNRKTIRHCKSISHRSANNICTHVLPFLLLPFLFFFSLFLCSRSLASFSFHLKRRWKQYKYTVTVYNNGHGWTNENETTNINQKKLSRNKMCRAYTLISRNRNSKARYENNPFL